MKNIIEIDGEKATLAFDPETAMFRGEFVGLAGGADFYAASVDELIKEGRKSLKIFLELCAEKGIEARRHFSGRFNVRLAPNLHGAAVQAASAHNMSLNEWVSRAIAEKIEA